MKKTLALILIAALTLSLAACGGNSGAGDTNTSGAGKDNAKEEMLANAPLLNISEMMQAFNENKIRACLKNVNTPNGRSFSAILPQFFLKYIQYSCEKLCLSGEKIPRHCAYFHFSNGA